MYIIIKDAKMQAVVRSGEVNGMSKCILETGRQAGREGETEGNRHTYRQTNRQTEKENRVIFLRLVNQP